MGTAPSTLRMSHVIHGRHASYHIKLLPSLLSAPWSAGHSPFLARPVAGKDQPQAKHKDALQKNCHQTILVCLSSRSLFRP